MNHYRSENIDKIMAALSKAQGMYRELICDCETTRGEKFSSLEAVLDATRDGLSENELGFTQNIEISEHDNGITVLYTRLGHSSGQHIGSLIRIVVGKTDQQTNNILEINKRLQASMLLGIAPKHNDFFSYDDNGQEQQDIALIQEINTPRSKQFEKTGNPISKEQYNELLIELEGYPEITKDIMTYYQIASLADVPKDEFYKIRKRIIGIKRTLEDYNKKKEQ